MTYVSPLRAGTVQEICKAHLTKFLRHEERATAKIGVFTRELSTALTPSAAACLLRFGCDGIKSRFAKV
jgi:hypothetical protein